MNYELDREWLVFIDFFTTIFFNALFYSSILQNQVFSYVLQNQKRLPHHVQKFYQFYNIMYLSYNCNIRLSLDLFKLRFLVIFLVASSQGVLAERTKCYLSTASKNSLNTNLCHPQKHDVGTGFEPDRTYLCHPRHTRALDVRFKPQTD